jgi:hypothetical protein
LQVIIQGGIYLIKNCSIAFGAILLAMILVMGCAKKQPPPKPVLPKGNVVWTEKAVAKPGETFALKVYIATIDTLAGVQIPLFFRNDNIKLICDSVSFEGGLLEDFMFHDVKIPLTCPLCGAKYDMFDNPPKEPGKCDKDGSELVQSDQAVFFMAIATIDPKRDVKPIYPGEGLLATVYFTVPKDSPKGVVPVTRGMIPHPTVSLVFSIWNERGDDLNGQLADGSIEIQ